MSKAGQPPTGFQLSRGEVIAMSQSRRSFFRWLGDLLLSLGRIVTKKREVPSFRAWGGGVLLIVFAWNQVVPERVVAGMNFGMAVCIRLCGCCLILLALIAIHELGHLIAARMVRIPCSCFAVGFFMLVREGKRLRARVNTAWFTQREAPDGYVQLEFPQDVKLWHVVLVLIAGPLANILIAVACFGAASGLNPSVPGFHQAAAPDTLTTGRRMALLLNNAGQWSLLMGLLNLVPCGAAGWRSDGGQLLDLWRLRPAAGIVQQAGNCQVALVLASGRVIREPTEKDILSSIAVEEFAILGTDLSYIQCARATTAPLCDYLLEYQAGSLDQHYLATDGPITLERVVSAFVKFLRRDWSCLSDHRWEKMDLSGQVVGLNADGQEGKQPTGRRQAVGDNEETFT
jgi:Peptidase family M50